MKNILKRMDIKILELSDYLNISRPTLYKFIDLYENKKFSTIGNKEIIKLFKFIEKNQYSSKQLVIKYIIDNYWRTEKEITSGSYDKLIQIVRKMDEEDVNILIKMLKGKQTWKKIKENLAKEN